MIYGYNEYDEPYDYDPYPYRDEDRCLDRCVDFGIDPTEDFYPEWDGPVGYFDLPLIPYPDDPLELDHFLLIRRSVNEHRETMNRLYVEFPAPDYDQDDIPF